MKLIFVRHGHPDYVNDCLTEDGKRQAAACAERLKNVSIAEIYSSPNGRARETAGYTAELLGLPVTVKDFMHEISWGADDGDKLKVYTKPGSHDQNGGHPWDTAEYLTEVEGINLLTCHDWREHAYFKHNLAVDWVDRVQAGFRDFMKDNGYEKVDGKWIARSSSDKTIAIFSHGGSGAAMMSELLELPFPYICFAFTMNFTSITVFELPESDRPFVVPRILKINDDLHVESKQVTYSN